MLSLDPSSFSLLGECLSSEIPGFPLLSHSSGLTWPGIPDKKVQLCLGLGAVTAQFWG